MNCLTVLPREIRAINKPINGAHAICHAQKKIVFFPNQSFSENGVKVRDIGTTFEIYPPNVVTKLSAINNVRPKIMINNIKIPAMARFVVLKILISLSSPDAAEIIKQTVTIAIIINWTEVVFGIGVK